VEEKEVRIAIGSDEAGAQLKQQLAVLISAQAHEVIDPGPSLEQHTRGDYAEQVALAVLRRDADRGVILTSRGVGASVAANRVPGIRAALCSDAFSAHSGAKSEGMNVLILAVHALDVEHAREVVDAYLGAALAPIEIVGGLPPRRLQRVLEYVKENIDKDLSVAEMAEVVGMSQYYFSKLFKLSTGTTPHQYVMRQRVERAQELLREGGTALVEVATHVGFETQSHFTSVFRRLVGITPKKFREMRAENTGIQLASAGGNQEQHQKPNATAA
jgi:RpiB/LacA/LacB family sugar-phosphate isomerase